MTLEESVSQYLQRHLLKNECHTFNIIIFALLFLLADIYIWYIHLTDIALLL